MSQETESWREALTEHGNIPLSMKPEHSILWNETETASVPVDGSRMKVLIVF
jgi:hypothetical protein